jgi:flagellar biosynthesis GTPase FlhF
MIAMLNFYDMRHQDGGLMDYSAMGAPGYRAEVTAREAAQNLEQSMTVVGSMGKNLEDGALNAIMAGAETVAINITYEELTMLMGREVADRYQVGVSDDFPTGLNLPMLTTGRFHVSGITALMKEQEKLSIMEKLIMPLFDPNGLGQIFGPYLKPGGYLNELVRLARLADSKFSVAPEKAVKIDQAQQDQQDAKIAAMKQQQEAEAQVAQAEAERKAAEAEKFRAEAQAQAAKAEALGAQAGLHEAKSELAISQADKADRETATEVATAAPPEPSPAEIAKAEQIRALTPFMIETEKAKAEQIRAQAKAAARPPEKLAAKPKPGGKG